MYKFWALDTYQIIPADTWGEKKKRQDIKVKNAQRNRKKKAQRNNNYSETEKQQQHRLSIQTLEWH